METPCERPKTVEKCRFDFMERGKFILGYVVDLSFNSALLVRFAWNSILKM